MQHVREQMTVILQNVRCFGRRHDIPVTPLTFLVGENSTGKTTFLAVLAALADPSRSLMAPSFNVPPYSLGAYEDIATLRPRANRLADSFTIGFSASYEGTAEPVRAQATFTNQAGQPGLSRCEMSSSFGGLRLVVEEGGVRYRIRVRPSAKERPRTISIMAKAPEDAQITPLGILDQALSQMAQLSKKVPKGTKELRRTLESLLPTLVGLLGHILPTRRRLISLGPIRTAPRRIFEAAGADYGAGGMDVLRKLAGFLQRPAKQRDVRTLRRGLEDFGTDSGLYSSIRIRTMRGKAAGPFQILVRVGGRWANLADVGYGVSQCLPIVAQSLLEGSDAMIAMQQPEIHLHPRAHAALGGLLARMVGSMGASFVVETHSGYLVDRVRQEVAKGTVDPCAVSILFFDRKGAYTTVFPLRLDANGNVLDAPPAYRAFFLEEEMNLLRRGK